MILSLFLLIAILLAAAGALLNIVFSLRDDNAILTRRLNQALDVPKPICNCGHGYSMHEIGGGCDQTVNWKARFQHTEYFDKRDVCRCKRYVGPEPLPQYYHPLELR